MGSLTLIFTRSIDTLQPTALLVLSSTDRVMISIKKTFKMGFCIRLTLIKQIKRLIHPFKRASKVINCHRRSLWQLIVLVRSQIRAIWYCVIGQECDLPWLIWLNWSVGLRFSAFERQFSTYPKALELTWKYGVMYLNSMLYKIKSNRLYHDLGDIALNGILRSQGDMTKSWIQRRTVHSVWLSLHLGYHFK